MAEGTEAVHEQTRKFWQSFYTRHDLQEEPSAFARDCLSRHLVAEDRIVELGCGNGRDTFAFLEHGMAALGVDGSDAAILGDQRRASDLPPQADAAFVVLDFEDIMALPSESPAWFARGAVSAVYSRFVLHAVPEAVEEVLFDFCDKVVPVGGLMLHEFRTIRDPLMQRGHHIGPYERVTDHYRRFVDPAQVRAKLARRGWSELEFVESRGLAVLGDDDPVVGRLVTRRTRSIQAETTKWLR